MNSKSDDSSSSGDEDHPDNNFQDLENKDQAEIMHPEEFLDEEYIN